MTKSPGKDANRYAAIIERIFNSRFEKGADTVPFAREDIEKTAAALGIRSVKNLGDLIYSFRHRVELPESIRKTAPPGREWCIKSQDRSQYYFALVRKTVVVPNSELAETKIPDATPGVIAKYALSDEQALLAKLRYNRLIDIFTGVACYSLQSHLRTTLPDRVQIETDEVYVGIDKRGTHYVLPVQAKGGSDRLGAIQIEQDLKMCGHKFPGLVCRAIGAQFLEGDVIALMEFVQTRDGDIRVAYEKHYRLVPPADVTDDDLKSYGRLPE